MHEVAVDPLHTDSDPQETAEWRDAFTALLAAHGARGLCSYPHLT